MEKSDDMLIIEARRKLNTGDNKDFVIPLDEEFEIGYAYHEGTFRIVPH